MLYITEVYFCMRLTYIHSRHITKLTVVKKYSSGLIKKTEQSLAEKAGHLEILKGGKKSKRDAPEKNVKGNGKER